MIQRNDPCWCGSGKKWKQCHFPTQETAPEFILNDKMRQLYERNDIILKTEEQIKGIRNACHLAAKMLDATAAIAKEGVSTLELNQLANKLHEEAGAIPAALNYGHPPYPKSICTSLNDVICHGIPDSTPLRAGDILNIDLACIYKGYFGDCSRMVVIGNTTPEKQLVVDVAYECLMRSIAILRPGVEICAIGNTIEAYATSRGCSVVNQFVGHGVGIRFHEGPQIPHNANQFRLPVAPGMIFTIEPMINAGVREAVIDPYDHWTARTKDGKPSAQWEHTILITENSYEILTPWIKK